MVNMGYLPAAWVLYCKTLPWYQMFDFRLDLPVHRQSAAAKFGALNIVLGTAIPVRDCGTFAAGANCS